MKVEIIDLKQRFKDEEIQILKCIKRVLKKPPTNCKGFIILKDQRLNCFL